MIVKNDKYFVRSARTFYRAIDPVRPVPSATIFLLVLLFLSRHPWSPLPPVVPVVVVVVVVVVLVVLVVLVVIRESKVNS